RALSLRSENQIFFSPDNRGRTWRKTELRRTVECRAHRGAKADQKQLQPRRASHPDRYPVDRPGQVATACGTVAPGGTDVRLALYRKTHAHGHLRPAGEYRPRTAAGAR